ncbi:MAG: MerR family transcriptional regulator, partial [Myxococcota bacterium]
MGALHPGEIAIGALARELGLTTATIHFYVKEGLVPPPRRINRTRAAYDDRHRRLLRLVKRLRANRLSIQQMRNMFALFGTDERGLANMEGIARYQPVPSARGGPTVKPLYPVHHAKFAAHKET